MSSAWGNVFATAPQRNVYAVNGIADLKNLSVPTGNATVSVDYGAAVGDSLGDLYSWNAGDARPDNGSTIIQPNSAPAAGRWNAAAFTFLSLALGAGTVVAPAITFAGDVTSGFYRPAANQIGVSISGVQRARFDSTGLIVTGSANPSVSLITPLVVTAQVLSSAAAAPLSFGLDVAKWQIEATTAHFFPSGGDNVQDIGKATSRIAHVFTPIIDSGTTGSVSLKTNNGTIQVLIDHNGSVDIPLHLSGGLASSRNALILASVAGAGIGYIVNANSHIFYSGGSESLKQFEITHTASVTRNLTATGSNGGQPILGASSSAGVAIVGTATNDNAASGQYGEFSSTNLGSGSAVALTTVTPANIISLTLGAGDWDVTGTLSFLFGATTSYTNLIGNWSATSATLSGILGSFFDYETAATVPTAGSDQSWTMPTTRFSLSGSTTIFLVAQGTFTVSTLKAYGAMRARRIR